MNPKWEVLPVATAARTLIEVERAKQDQKWGVQNHAFDRWLAILQEEIGEASQAWLGRYYSGELPEKNNHFLDEVVQIAAVATAIVENVLAVRYGERDPKEAN